MPRGTPKRGAFDFTIWFEDGGRANWKSLDHRLQTNADIAAAIRRYLMPFVERIEHAQAVDAVDPQADSHPKPSTREKT